MILKTLFFFMLQSFVYIESASYGLEFPKDHQFSCQAIFNDNRCSKNTRKVFVYDSVQNKCVKKTWRGCTTGNMFYDADNCNNACRQCITDDADYVELMDLKYFTDALTTKNKTVFNKVLNTLEAQLRMLADQDSLITKRANIVLDEESDADEDPVLTSRNANSRKSDVTDPDKLDVENNKYDENNESSDNENLPNKEARVDDEQEEDNNDDYSEADNSELL